MGWNDIETRTIVRLYEQDVLSQIFKGLVENLYKDKPNYEFSRKIMPTNGNFPTYEQPVTRSEYFFAQCEIIRYMASSMLSEAKSKGKSEIYGRSITELEKIKNMTEIDIRESIVSRKASFISSVFNTCCYLFDYRPGGTILPQIHDSEHNGAEVPYLDKNEYDGYMFRIYLNPPKRNKANLKFILEYIKKCIDKRIPFDMKAAGTGGTKNNLDGTILYSNSKYLDRHIDAIEEVIAENPDIMEKFGTPICTGGMVKSKDNPSKVYYTISAGIPVIGATYNDEINAICRVAFSALCAEIVKKSDKSKYDVIEQDLFNKTENIHENIHEYFEGRKNDSASVGTRFINPRATNMQKLALRLIQKKRGSLTKEQKQRFDYILLNDYGTCIKKAHSLLKFGDLDHTGIPIYMDKNFLRFHKESRQTKRENR